MPSDFDPNAPLMPMTRELVEVSTAPIDDSVLQVLSGFRKVESEDILKDDAAGTAPLR